LERFGLVISPSDKKHEAFLSAIRAADVIISYDETLE